MFKKFKTGILIIILAILLIIYLFVRYSGSDDRTFRDKILSFDANSITQVLINEPNSTEAVVDLRKSGDNWYVRVNDREYMADTNNVKNILKSLSDLPTKRYAGKDKEAWVKYEVTDSMATHVTLKDGDKIIAEILIGKFAYNMPKNQQQQIQSRQQRGDMTSYVRLVGEKDVYATEGFLKMSVSSSIDSYRNRHLISVNPQDITRISITEPGSRRVYESRDGKWMLNGTLADSTFMANYTKGLANLVASKFIEDDVQNGVATHTVMVEGNNFNPVEIQAYPSADTTINYIISSSVNPGSFFNGKEGGLFKKIWE